jgi:hypothetical protein
LTFLWPYNKINIFNDLKKLNIVALQIESVIPGAVREARITQREKGAP